jgi:hypothetical protein
LNQLDALRYPVGEFTSPSARIPGELESALAQIAACPGELARAVVGLSGAQLDTPYRDGGWTVRQVVHHVADSHMNAYIRHKLAVTEERPTIKTYAEASWAELSDGRGGGVEVSLVLLGALHERWGRFLRSLEPLDFERTFHHPAIGGPVALFQSVAMYAWHGRHHVAHIDALRRRQAW